MIGIGEREFYRHYSLDVLLDVIVTFVLLIVLYLALLLLEPGHVFRVLLTIPVLLFLPGYALTTIAFPEKKLKSENPGDRTITIIERAALSVGMSITLIPPLGLALWLFGWGITPLLAFATVAVATLVLLAVGGVRRFQLPEDIRFTVPYHRLPEKVLDVTRNSTQVDGALNVILAVAVLLSVGSLLFPVVAPQDSSTFTEFSLLTENSTGELVASGYPSELRKNEREPLIFNVENHEHRDTQYTVVVQVVKMNSENDVTNRTEIHRFHENVPVGNTWRVRHDVFSPVQGDRVRLTYLLYKGEPPSNPTSENAYRNLYISTNVSNPI